MGSLAEKAIRRKADREERRRKRRERGLPEEEDRDIEESGVAGPVGDKGPAGESAIEKRLWEEGMEQLEEADSGEEPILRLDVLRKDGKITYRQGSRTWLEDPPEGTSGEQGEAGSAMDEFEAEAAASDGFSDEKPQPTFEEKQDVVVPADIRRRDAVYEPSKELVTTDSRGNEITLPQPSTEADAPVEPMEQLSNSILSDAEAQALAGSAYEEGDPRLQEEGRVYPEEEGKSREEILKDREAGREAGREADKARQAAAKATAEDDYNAIRDEVRDDMGMTDIEEGKFDTALGAPGATDQTRELAEEAKKKEVYDRERAGANREISYLENTLRNVGSGGAISPEDSEHVQRYKEEQAAKKAQRDDERRRGTHRYVGDTAYEDDIRVAKEAAARQKARGPDALGYERSATEPPMTNKNGEQLPGITYDPKLSTVENVVVDGVIVDRIVKDKAGVRGEEDATRKREGKVWVIPTKHGFRLGSPEAAGQGPGHWVRKDQAEQMVATVASRQEREDEVTELKRLRKRTPLEVREDQLREQREHEEELKRIEFDQDDDLEDEAKKEMEIKRLQTLLAQPGLTVAQKRLYQQQLNALLGAAPVAGAGAGEAMSPADAATSLQAEDSDLYEYLQTEVQPYMVSSGLRTNEGNVEQAYLAVSGLIGTKITPQNVHQVGPLIFSMFTEEALLRVLAEMEGQEEQALSWFEEGPSHLKHRDIYEFFMALKEGRMPTPLGPAPDSGPLESPPVSVPH